MKSWFAIVNTSMFLSLICAVPGYGQTVLMSNLGEPNIGSYNFGAVNWAAVPFQTGSSPITVSSIDLLMLQYQPVADQPFVQIYTDAGSQPGTLVPGAQFTPQSPLTSGSSLHVVTFDNSTPVTLAPNTDYDVVVSAHTLDGYWAWGLQQGTGVAGPGGQILPGTVDLREQGWVSVSGSFGFDLQGSVVPEPSTFMLIGLGGVALLRKRA